MEAIEYLKRRLNGIQKSIVKIEALPDGCTGRWADGQLSYFRLESEQLKHAIKEMENGKKASDRRAKRAARVGRR